MSFTVGLWFLTPWAPLSRAPVIYVNTIYHTFDIVLTLNHPSLHIWNPHDGRYSSSCNRRHRVMHCAIYRNVSGNSPSYRSFTYHRYSHAHSPPQPSRHQTLPEDETRWLRESFATPQRTVDSGGELSGAYSRTAWRRSS